MRDIHANYKDLDDYRSCWLYFTHLSILKYQSMDCKQKMEYTYIYEVSIN